MRNQAIYTDKELIRRYKAQYQIPEKVEISAAMISKHWNLERELTLKLLASTTQNRWEVFETCYNRLYAELEWLNKLPEEKTKQDPSDYYKLIIQSIGSPPQKIYEIGSGKGELIEYLATLGHECHATEISKERGGYLNQAPINLTWSISDGVHLDLFEPPGYYDIVYSGDVIEHLHPDDLEAHFFCANKILRKGGKYILQTPHRFFSPSDISKVMGYSTPMGMHLKEYMVNELVEKMNMAGFRKISLPFKLWSRRYYRIFGRWVNDELLWIMRIERVLARLPNSIRDMILNDRRIFPLRKIYLVAEK
jgi:cyclopropane fatty-acyl-phospholipid synthase-like methyltransferase